MPPKKVYVQPASSRRQPKGFFRSTYDSLTSPENSSMVKAIASFGVSACPIAMLPLACVSWRKANLLFRSALLSLQARGASFCFLRKLQPSRRLRHPQPALPNNERRTWAIRY